MRKEPVQPCWRTRGPRVLTAKLGGDPDSEIVADALGPIDEQRCDVLRAQLFRRFSETASASAGSARR